MAKKSKNTKATISIKRRLSLYYLRFITLIKIGILFYVIADYLSAMIGWMLFLFYRKISDDYVTMLYKDEIPYSCEVEIESFVDKSPKLSVIDANIIVSLYMALFQDFFFPINIFSSTYYLCIKHTVITTYFNIYTVYLPCALTNLNC
jgi:hypothetical protein